MMVLKGNLAVQVPLASKVTLGHLEFLAHLVQEETRDRMGYLDLLERKERWEYLSLDLRDEMERKVHLGVPGRRVPPVPLDLLGHLVQQEIQAAPDLLDHLALPVFLVRKESAFQEARVE